jgi:hypothetical protein
VIAYNAFLEDSFVSQNFINQLHIGSGEAREKLNEFQSAETNRFNFTDSALQFLLTHEVQHRSRQRSFLNFFFTWLNVLNFSFRFWCVFWFFLFGFRRDNNRFIGFFIGFFGRLKVRPQKFRTEFKYFANASVLSKITERGSLIWSAETLSV